LKGESQAVMCDVDIEYASCLQKNENRIEKSFSKCHTSKNLLNIKMARGD